MIIYDASAFFERISRKDLDLNGFILDLTLYEVGNTIRKHYKHLKLITKEEAQSFLNILSNWKNILAIRTEDATPIFELSTQLDLTVYDAAYVHFAQKYNALLETCDKPLYERGRRFCHLKFLSY